jgi:ferritin-like metal-binding protein YciE
MPSETLHAVFVDELKDIYHAEKQLVKALPKMAKAASDPELKSGFLSHLEETKGHVARLEQVFAAVGEPVRAKPCKAMQGLVEEGAEVIEENESGPLRDVALIGAAQRVEHYEIAAYGTVRTLAEQLGQDQAVGLLQATLDEEGACDKTLTKIAGSVNRVALEEFGAPDEARPANRGAKARAKQAAR